MTLEVNAEIPLKNRKRNHYLQKNKTGYKGDSKYMVSPKCEV